jgi:chromosomal replication initiator protein
VESSKNALGKPKSIHADAPIASQATQDAGDAKVADSANTNQSLNPRYTFDLFVTGKSNELARAACMAVAERPGLVYNPLFIYGGAGLGKTHLMQAVGHSIFANSPDKKVLYVSSEKFTNDFIQAITRGNGEKFKQRYRSVDVLLVDDIQFLAGKEGTQEEFFHTFNALHQANKQIVITSDRPPKSIPALENRLVSRFEWGMIADIAQPDLETRIAILSAKSKERNYNLSTDVLHAIASTVQSNIRELEGALNRIVAYHQLNNTEPTLEGVKSLLVSVARAPKRGGVTPRQITQTVADFFELRVADLFGASRKKELVVPRQIAMYLMREELQSSFPSIGIELGNRDHTTAMHACSKISAQLENDERLKQNIALILQRLYNA